MECPEAAERGRNFRLLAEEELSQLLDLLTGYLPESLKVRDSMYRLARDRLPLPLVTRGCIRRERVFRIPVLSLRIAQSDAIRRRRPLDTISP